MRSILGNQLEEFRDSRRNAFVSALTISSEGRHLAGIYGVNIPREILWALDIVPINIYSIDGSNISAAEELIDDDICSLIKASYGYTITDKCPFAHFADIIVASDMCPNKIFVVQKFSSLKKLYISPELNDVDALILEYRRFVYYLEKEFNLKISDTKLACAIKKTNAISKKTQEILDLFMLKPDIIGCDDLFSIIYGSQFILDLDQRYAKLSAVKDSLECINNETHLFENVKHKRILICGAPQAALKEKILSPISAINHTIAVFAPSSCEGENYQIVNEAKDPYTALAEKYLYSQPLLKLERLVATFEVDAIINVNLAGCNTLNVRYEFLGKPYLCITTDYSNNDDKEILRQLNSFISNL